MSISLRKYFLANMAMMCQYLFVEYRLGFGRSPGFDLRIELRVRPLILLEFDLASDFPRESART